MERKHIVVQGTANIKLRPDLVVLTMTLSTLDLNYNASLQLLEDSLINLRESLYEIGYSSTDIKTLDFTVSPENESYRQPDGKYKDRFKGYRCTQRIVLRFDFTMDNLSEAINAITSSGANPTFTIEFSVKDKESVQDKLLTQAVNDAQRKAEILTTASKVILGEIIKIDYKQNPKNLLSRTSFDNLNITQSRMNFEPDDIESFDSVTISWAIE